jgi:hypothetical protein
MHAQPKGSQGIEERGSEQRIPFTSNYKKTKLIMKARISKWSLTDLDLVVYKAREAKMLGHFSEK